MTGDDFIRLAHRLALGPRAAEAEFRTAASRAYYGAFHLVSEFLDSIGCYVPESPAAHAFVQLRLSQCEQPDAVMAGLLLRDLHSERLKADYRLRNAKSGTKEFALYCIETTARFESALATCSAEPARTDVIAGIRAYERAVYGGPAAES